MEIDRIRMQVLDSEKFDEHFLSFPPKGIILIYFYINIILYILYIVLYFINVNCDF